MAHRRFSRPQKRGTFWLRTDAASGGAGFKALGASTSVIDQSLSGGGLITIVRTRGMIQAISDQEVAAESPFGAFGIAIVSAQALAVGVTAIPTPYTDADSDLWFVHGYWAAPLGFGDATGFANISQRVDFDSKAMRKFSEDEAVVMVIENATVVGAEYLFNFAMLFKSQ